MRSRPKGDELNRLPWGAFNRGDLLDGPSMCRGGLAAMGRRTAAPVIRRALLEARHSPPCAFFGGDHRCPGRRSRHISEEVGRYHPGRRAGRGRRPVIHTIRSATRSSTRRGAWPLLGSAGSQSHRHSRRGPPRQRRSSPETTIALCSGLRRTVQGPSPPHSYAAWFARDRTGKTPRRAAQSPPMKCTVRSSARRTACVRRTGDRSGRWIEVQEAAS